LTVIKSFSIRFFHRVFLVFFFKRERGEMKRKRVDPSQLSGIYQVEEPRSVQGVPPSTATMLLDSNQEARDGITTRPPVYSSTYGLTSEQGPIFTAGPVDHNEKVPFTGGDVTTGLHNVIPYSAGVDEASHFSSTINPLTGCSRTSYYGSYDSNAEWDTHRGNSILSFRVFIEPKVQDSAQNYYIHDFWIKVPDGLSFGGGDLQGRNSFTVGPDTDKKGFSNARMVADLLSELLASRTWGSSGDRFNLDKGWNTWQNNTYSEPAAGGGAGQFVPLLTATVTGDNKLLLQFHPERMAGIYTDSNSTFVLFDHPNSLTNRGGLWSGMGIRNPYFGKGHPLPTTSAPLTFVQSGGGGKGTSPLSGFPPRYVTYGLGGGLVEREPIPLTDFITSKTGQIFKTEYDAIKKKTFDLFKIPSSLTRSLFKNGSPPSGGGLIAGIMNIGNITGYRQAYAGTRIPLMMDTRYVIHSSSELSYDRKMPPYMDKNLLAAGPIGSDMIGIDFRESRRSSRTQGTFPLANLWEEDDEILSNFNANIFLSRTGSTMRIEVFSYNEWGELLLSSPGANTQGMRNTLPGENLFQPATSPALYEWVAYAKHLYPNVNLDTSPALLNDRKNSATGNFPQWSYYDLQGKATFPTTFIESGKVDEFPERRMDFVLYYDNQSRASAGDSVVHFLLNEMYN
jgi:hypothetical protein